jgi:hypothetical protein
MNEPTMERIAQLQQMIADFASIFRVPQLADKERAEMMLNIVMAWL